jgi:DNA-binding CsgD family transcriptional regulator
MRALGLRSAAIGPRAATWANPHGLTDRQLEILRLIGKGLSYAEIAMQLSITPKTAGHHVSAVLAKLGVRTRHQVARVLDQSSARGMVTVALSCSDEQHLEPSDESVEEEAEPAEPEDADHHQAPDDGLDATPDDVGAEGELGSCRDEDLSQRM